MLKELNILFNQHGKQYIPDLDAVQLPTSFRGRPVICSSITLEQATEIALLCPTGAFTASPCGIDLGKCVFCNECHWALPNKIKFTNDYFIASNKRDSLFVKVGVDSSIIFDKSLIRNDIKNFFRNALKLRQISAGGDNSTEMELNAAGNVNFDMGRFGIEFVASPRHADGIVITGPLSENMAQAVQIAFEAIPNPKIIILAGTDAISSGIFAKSKAVNRNFIDSNFIDLFIPGNPVHPLTFIDAVLKLVGKK